jgi:hypothetical protein
VGVGRVAGSTHDTAAARIWNILAALEEAGLIALGDNGYHGYDQTRERVSRQVIRGMRLRCSRRR